MRELTTLGLKLLGILGLYWAATIMPQIGMALSMLVGNSAHGYSASWYLASLVAWFVISLLFAILLLSRTGWIVSKLRVPSDSIQAHFPSPSHLLRAGLVLIGVFAILESVPDLIQALYEASQFGEWPGYHRWARFIGGASKLVLALIVIGRSAQLTQRIFPISTNEA